MTYKTFSLIAAIVGTFLMFSCSRVEQRCLYPEKAVESIDWISQIDTFSFNGAGQGSYSGPDTSFNFRYILFDFDQATQLHKIECYLKCNYWAVTVYDTCQESPVFLGHVLDGDCQSLTVLRDQQEIFYKIIE